MTIYTDQTTYPLTPDGELTVYKYWEKGCSVPFWGAHYTLKTGSCIGYPFKELLTRKPSKRQIQNWIDQLSH